MPICTAVACSLPDFSFVGNRGDQWDISLQSLSWHISHSVLFLDRTDRIVLHGSASSWRKLCAGIFSDKPETAGGRGGGETLIVCGPEIYSVSGKECCPEHFRGVARSVRECLLALALSVRSEHSRYAQWNCRWHQIGPSLAQWCHKTPSPLPDRNVHPVFCSVGFQKAQSECSKIPLNVCSKKQNSKSSRRVLNPSALRTESSSYSS